ncbi:hypothetical protein Vretimale_15248 [Volvox reticuliferus]|uniref:WDR5-like beta-propeller domain-containing protein n=1 Tax=Volvox reticuliferus TaxID=1737510 RepID=A0A8J4GR93_9CHLO|nr:hypothetical protein Vretifemale_5439 [Volvox reticuliferus]GIM11777.1 hypothetical protein Vretimale_15248 [Volvox reticuliferus]
MSKRSRNIEFRCQKVLDGHSKAVASVKFAPSGLLLATASADKTVCLWDVTTGSRISTLSGHTCGISDVSWNPNQRYLATAADDNTLKLWDVETGTCLRTLTGHTNYVFCCNFDPPGHLLASGSFDETMRLWDVRTGKCLREVPAHSDPLTAVHFAYDGTMIVSSSLDGLIRLWDTQTGHCLKTLFDRDSPPVSFAMFSPNAKYVLCNTLDSRVRIWDYERGRTVKTYEGGHVNKQFCMTSGFCTTDLGHWIVTGSEDNSLCIYDLNTQNVLSTVPSARAGGDNDAANVAATDGSGGGGTPQHGTIPASNGGTGCRSGGHTAPVLAVNVHPSLPVIASGAHSPDNTVRMWMAAEVVAS